MKGGAYEKLDFVFVGGYLLATTKEKYPTISDYGRSIAYSSGTICI